MNLFESVVSEITVRYSPNIPVKDRIKVNGSSEIYQICKLFWPEIEHVEHFYILNLDRGNKIIGAHLLSKGGFTGTVIDIRAIFQVPLKACACSIIAIHNHPSGNTQPSDADHQVTQKIKEAGKILEIQLLDHLIITADKYFSFADEGLL